MPSAAWQPCGAGPYADGSAGGSRQSVAGCPLWTRITANPLFDRLWYVARYPDVRDAGIDPVRHYRDFGLQEGRDPNPMFDTRTTPTRAECAPGRGFSCRATRKAEVG